MNHRNALHGIIVFPYWWMSCNKQYSLSPKSSFLLAAIAMHYAESLFSLIGGCLVIHSPLSLCTPLSVGNIGASLAMLAISDVRIKYSKTYWWLSCDKLSSLSQSTGDR